MPHAREMFDAHLNKIADYCVNEGIQNTDDGNWTISYDEIYEHFGTVIDLNNRIGEILLEKLKQRKEVDIAIATEDEFEMMYHLENCPECQQGGLAGALSLLSLIGCNLENVHFVCAGESVDSDLIPHLSGDTLTDEGKQEFADVLSAKVTRIYGSHKSMTVELSGCSAERVRMLSKVLRGDCTLEDYHRYVFQKPGECVTPKRTVTQDEIDIASAKHTLWRLDQPSGQQADFTDCDLCGLDLSRKDFNGADFSHVRMRDCRAVDTEFCGVAFCDADIRNCCFNRAMIEDSDWSDARVEDCGFQETELSGSNFSGATFKRIEMDDARLTNCVLPIHSHGHESENADTHAVLYP